MAKQEQIPVRTLRGGVLVAFIVILLGECLGVSTALASADRTLFGPKRYGRQKGAPTVYNDTFGKCVSSDQVLLRVRNGSGKESSITAGRITVNGVSVLEEKDFKQQTELYERLITVKDVSDLRVELKSGGPQTPFVVIEIIGKNCDATPPVIVRPSPAVGSLTNSAQPLISAGFRDETLGSGVDARSVRLIVDDADVTAAASVSADDISYTPGSRLNDGIHNVSLAVADFSANPTTLAWRFTTDTTPPALTVSTLADGSFTNKETLNVAGSVTDRYGVKELFVNSTAVTVNADGSFSTALILKNGDNAIKVMATDLAGNSTGNSRTITLDTVLPVVTITTPAVGFLTRTTQIAVTGTVSEPNSTVTVNGIPATVTGSSWIGQTLLTEGANSLTVRATDRAGNQGSATITVNLDSTPPSTPILKPLPSPTNRGTIALSGTAEGDSVVKILLNSAPLGTVTAAADRTFTFPSIPLMEGENSFTALAVDAAGNAGAASQPLVVVLDTKPPVITVTLPADKTFTRNQQLSIQGTVDEPVATLVMNGVPVTLNGAAFDTTITLNQGLNTLTLSATDLAGNVGTATVGVTLDTTPPKVTITTPVTGFLTNNPLVTVSGTVDKADATLTMNGQPLVVTGSAFSTVVTLTEGDNRLMVQAVDRAGNNGSAMVTATLDSHPPTVNLTAPLEAAAGATVQIGVNAADDRDLRLLEVRTNGAPIWSASPTGPTGVSDSFSFRLPPDLAAAAQVDLQARGADAAGNLTTATARIAITQGASGPGSFQGKVFDDTRGLPLAGATVTVTDSTGTTLESVTGDDGGWYFQLPAGEAVAKITKSGWTSVLRRLLVRPEQNGAALDSRLTPLATATVVGVAGGTVKAELGATKPVMMVDLTVPAGALLADSLLRLTPVSNQGLMDSLPAGWSPVAGVDLRSVDQAGNPVTVGSSVKIPLPAALNLVPATIIQVGFYDETAHRWLKGGEGSITENTFTALVSSSGQYAFLVADPAPNAPPAAVTGQPLLAASTVTPDFTAITAAGRVVPQAALPSTGLRAAGEVVLTGKSGVEPKPVFTSGLVLTAKITEKFDLKSGDTVLPVAYSQDIVIYRTPCLTNIANGAVTPVAASEAELRTTFPISPSREFTLVDLLLGKVGVEIVQRQTDSASGFMVGPDGGRSLDGDGTILGIPAGALSQSVPVATQTIPPASAPAFWNDLTLLKGIEVALSRQQLSQSAILSIPVPSGLDPALPIVVAKRLDVKGVAKLKLVALGKITGSLITSDAAGMAGIVTSGSYYFLQAKTAIGFVIGTVTDNAAAPFAGALVTTSSGSLVDLTSVAGKYLLAAPAGSVNATALDLYKQDRGIGTATIAANQTVPLDLVIRMVPPRLLKISPADNAGNIQPGTQVTATFTKSLDRTSVTPQSFKLSTAQGSVSGVFSFNPDATVVTFYPAEPLKSETVYTVTLSGAIIDQQGYPLGQEAVSRFTVRKTAPPPMPAAGSVSATFPDADGFITVTATQGTAEIGNTVLLINDTSGEIVSVTPQSNGAFIGRIRGQLGDEIQVVLMDYSGNRTLVSYITYKSDDGKYLVTAKGGQVEGEGGSLLEIPEGALSGAALVRITPLLENGLPHPVPQGGKFIGALYLDTGGMGLQKEVHLSIPLPPGMPSDAVPFLAQPQEVTNFDGIVEKAYVIIDSTKVINGRLSTASPPFEGVVTPGPYVFLYVKDPLIGDVIVSGTAYQDMDGIPGYMPGSDKPISGAIIRSPQMARFIAYTGAKGHYATFGFAAQGVCRNFPLTAIHPQTMNQVSVNVSTCEVPYVVNNFNFKLADKDTVIPDKTPPLINFELQVAAGQGPDARIVAGTTPLGTKLRLPIAIIDQEMKSVSCTVRYDDPTTGAGSDTSVVLGSPTTAVYTVLKDQRVVLYKYEYQAELDQGFFIPVQPGYYTFTVEATDAAGNKSSRVAKLHSVLPGTNLGVGREGAPQIDDVSPADKTTEVVVTSPIVITFNEPVQNVEESLKLYDISDPAHPVPVLASVILSINNGLMQATVTPSGNLAYAREYKVVAATTIKDTEVNSSAPNAPPNGDGLLHMVKEFTSTFRTREPNGYDLMTDQRFTGGRDVDLYTFSPADGGSDATYAYIMAGDKGWRIVDLTRPSSPNLIYPRPDLGIPTPGYSFPIGFSYRGVAVHPDRSRGLLAMTESVAFPDGNQFGNIRFYSLLDAPGNPTAVGFERLAESYSGMPGKVALYSDYALVSTSMAGIQIVNIKSAMKRLTGELTEYGAAISGVIDTMALGYGSPNDIAVLNERSGVFTTNAGYLLIADLNLPTDQDSIDNNAPVAPLIASAFKPSGYSFFRVGSAADFTCTDEGGTEKSINLVVTSTTQGMINTVDVSDPYHPAIIGTAVDGNNHQVQTTARDISINKNAKLAFVTTFTSIQVYDIKDPRRPRLVNEFTQLPSASGQTGTDGKPVMVTFADTQAIVEKNGWVYQANQSRGLVVLDLNLAQLECVGGVNCTYDVERVYHLGQYETSGTLSYYTDSYKIIPVILSADAKVAVSLLDRDGVVKKVLIAETPLSAGPYNFIVDYETVKKAGFDSTSLPDYIIYVTVKADGSEPEKKVHFGRISERIDGKMLEATVVHDVLLQDGSLNLSRQDFSFKGRGPQLSFGRTYNNQHSGLQHRPLGNGWSHSLDLRLSAITSDEYKDNNPLPTWLTPDKKGVFLTPSPDSAPKNYTRIAVNGIEFKKTDQAWLPDRGHHGTLTEIDRSSFIFTSKEGVKYSYGYPESTDTPMQVNFIQDPAGNKMSFAYNRGRLEKVTDAVGRSCSFTYDNLPICDKDPSRLMSVVCADDVKIEFHYTEKGYLEEVKRGRRVEKYEYAMERGVKNGDYQLVKAIDANGHVSTYAYGPDDVFPQADHTYVQILRTQNIVRSVTYQDQSGGPLAVNFNYDMVNRQRTVRDARGNAVLYTLNRYGNPTNVDEKDGTGATLRTTSMLWSIDAGLADNVLVSRTDGRKYTTTYKYDAMGNVIKETDPLGKSIDTTWDQNYGLPISRKDRNGYTQKWTYDKGSLTSYTDGEEATTKYENYTNGLRRSMTGPKGPAYVTTYEYDFWGNLRSVTEPEGSITRHTNDIRGRLIDSTDPNGNQTSYAYDDLDYPITVELPDHTDSYDLPTGSSAIRRFEYDAVGNLTKETDRVGLTLKYVYTPRNQVAKVIRSGAGIAEASRTFEYDQNGNLTSETDWLGRITSHTYDPLNRRVTTRNRNGHIMKMGYDANNNLIREEDYEGRVTDHEYDALNRLTTTRQPALPGQQEHGELNYTYYNETDPKTNLWWSSDQEQKVLAVYEYNGRYQPVRRTDPLSKEHTWQYDPAGNLHKETDEEGRTTTFDYDKQHRLTVVHLPALVVNGQAESPVITHSYDAAGNRISTTDARSNTTTMQYDEWNRLWKVITPDDPISYESITKLDGEGREVRTTDGNNVSRSKIRDSLGRIISAIDGEGNSTTFTYDANGNVATITESNGTVTTNSYDREDRLEDATETAAASGTESTTRSQSIIQRDRVGNPLKVKDFNGNTSTTVYNALNLPSAVCDPAPNDGRCTTTDYYKNGKVKSVTNRRGMTTEYEYDDLNRLSQVIDPLGQTIETNYDGVGNVTSITDKLGKITKKRYNTLNLLEEQTVISGTTIYPVAAYAYDLAGNRILEVDANGNKTRHTYTPRNLLATTTYPMITPASTCPATADASRTFTYDGVGNLLTETDELKKVTSYTYDRENRRTSTEFAGEKTETKYTFFGKPMSIIKSLGNGQVFTYDGFKRLTGVTEGGPVQWGGIVGGLTTTYGYDVAGNLRHQYGPSGDHTEYIYDELNRKISHIQHVANETTDGPSPTTTYLYDEEGNPTTVTDALQRETTYSYDELNRLTDTRYAENSSPYLTLTDVRTKYDENNSVTGVTETKIGADGKTITDVTVNVYNDLDRLESSTQRGVTVSYAYDPNGNRTRVETPNGATTYTFDERNRLRSVNESTHYCYRPDGLKSKVSYPNGTESSYSYYDNKRIKLIANKTGTQVFSSYEYEYDANGNRTKQTELQNGLTRTTTYAGLDQDRKPTRGYDSLDRLTNFVVELGVVTTQTDFGYEGYNRKSEKVASSMPVKTIVDGKEVITYRTLVKNVKSYVYDGLNRLMSVTDSADRQNPHVVSYQYDRNGNTIRKTDSSLTPAFTDTIYDYDSLNHLVQAKQGDVIHGQFDYDANGMRVRYKGSDRGDVAYYHDGRSVIEERNAGDSSLLARYSYADKLVSLETTAGSQYFHHDALGSTVNLTDAVGNTQAGYVLNPFGLIVDQFGDSVNRQVFTGKENDARTGLVYFGARYYDPGTGRFINQDSYLGETTAPPSLHRYLYAKYNPTVYIDLYGHESVETWHHQIATMIERLSNDTLDKLGSTKEAIGISATNSILSLSKMLKKQYEIATYSSIMKKYDTAFDLDTAYGYDESFSSIPYSGENVVGVTSIKTEIAAVPGYPEVGKTMWRKDNDQIFIEEINKYNNNYGLSSEDDGFATPERWKAQAMVESGGSRSAFLRDPLQVNNPGDWDKAKITIAGIQKKQVMTPRTSIAAALEWSRYKGYVHDSKGNEVRYKGLYYELRDYNGNVKTYLKHPGVEHRVWYANDILRLERIMKK